MTIGEGMESGKGWLIEDPQRRDVFVTKRSIQVKGRNGQLEDVPAGLTLREICQQYPNACWGKMLRIFFTEGWTERQIHDNLPVKGKTAARAHNYLQKAKKAELCLMNADAGRIRLVTQNKFKGRKTGSKRTASQLDDGVGLNDHEVDNHPQKKTRRSESSQKDLKVQLSVLHSGVVRNLNRQPGQSRPYPASIAELQLQHQVYMETQENKLLMTNRLVLKGLVMANSPLGQRLQAIEQQWRDEFNGFVAATYLTGTDDMLPPVLLRGMDAFEVLLTIVEFEERNTVPKRSSNELRMVAYSRLLDFLAWQKRQIQQDLNVAFVDIDNSASLIDPRMVLGGSLTGNSISAPFTRLSRPQANVPAQSWPTAAPAPLSYHGTHTRLTTYPDGRMEGQASSYPFATNASSDGRYTAQIPYAGISDSAQPYGNGQVGCYPILNGYS